MYYSTESPCLVHDVVGYSFTTQYNLSPEFIPDWRLQETLRRRQACQLASLHLVGTEYQAYAQSIATCGTSRFICRKRGCPFCAGGHIRSTLRPLRQIASTVPLPVGVYALPVTFTLPNCGAEELGQSFDRLNDGWRGMARRTPFKGSIGALWAQETTVSSTLYAGWRFHPHAHATWLFATKDQAVEAAECAGQYFERAAGLIREEGRELHPPDIKPPFPVQDRVRLRHELEYAGKLVPVETVEDLVQDRETYLAWFRALNCRRPFRRLHHAVARTGVLGARGGGGRVTRSAVAHIAVSGSLQ